MRQPNFNRLAVSDKPPNNMNKQNETIIEINETVEKLIRKGFGFTLIHRPPEKKVAIISVIEPDKIKHQFPSFNIYMKDRNQKVVEKVFFYDE